jgi:bifunctional non-homologous end joining protein LigD
MLKKVTDEYAGGTMGLTDRYLTSIKTGRTMQEIAAAKKAKELKGWKRGLTPPRNGEGDRAKRGWRGPGAGGPLHHRRFASAVPLPVPGRSKGPRLPAAAEGDARRSRPGRLRLDPRDEI